MSQKIYCGIEGGASVSKLVFLNEKAEILFSLEGPAANHLLVGIEECQKRIAQMIEDAKEKAGLPKDLVLDALGLCMSGCEVDEANRQFEISFSKKYPHIMKSCTVASDTMGPLYSASPKGGLVLIAGTGSNALLLNPDGTTGRCGGWGHFLGDEASAMWISRKAVKTVFDDEDNLVTCPHDTSKVKELMLEHFEVSDKFGIIEQCYVNFSKSRFAGLCAKLAKAAIEEKDPLCCSLFYEAGYMLGKMVAALKPKVSKDLLDLYGGLPILCVGSVFKSWQLLEKGFVESLGNHYAKCTLITVTCSSAVGAAYVGAQSLGVALPLDFEKNCSVLFNFESTQE